MRESMCKLRAVKFIYSLALWKSIWKDISFTFISPITFTSQFNSNDASRSLFLSWHYYYCWWWWSIWYHLEIDDDDTLASHFLYWISSLTNSLSHLLNHFPSLFIKRFIAFQFSYVSTISPFDVLNCDTSNWQSGNQ